MPVTEEEDYVTNPVMVQAMNKVYQFDDEYENEFEGANITMDMST